MTLLAVDVTSVTPAATIDTDVEVQTTALSVVIVSNALNCEYLSVLSGFGRESWAIKSSKFGILISRKQLSSWDASVVAIPQ